MISRREAAGRGSGMRAPWRAAVVAVAIAAMPACGRDRAPSVPFETYRQAVTSFYTGLAAMQTSQDALARGQFEQVTQLVPQEPAGWANLGLLLLRQQEVDGAMPHLTRAAELAPDSAAIQRLLGLAEARRGDLEASIRHWRRALEIDPGDARAAYALAREIERQGSPESDAEAQRVLETLLERTDNLVARIDATRLAAKRGDADGLARGLAALEPLARGWPEEAQARFKAVQEAAATPRAAAPAMAFLKNVLLRAPEYRRALAAVSTPREEVGEPLERFLVLDNPDPQPSEPDTGLTMTLQAAGDEALGEGGPDTDAHAVHADFNYDYRVDVAIAGPEGLRLLRRGESGALADVTAEAKLPAALRTARFACGWAADIDTEGDLDLVAAVENGPLYVLRNNNDGTFTPQQPFAGVANARGFAWADLDGEGVPDAAVLDADGRVRLFVNLRGGALREEPVPAVRDAVAIAAAEASGDTILDLLVLSRDGAITRVSRRDGGWEAQEIARGTLPGGGAPGMARLLVADLDNNAAPDFILTGAGGTSVLLGSPAGFVPTTQPLPAFRATRVLPAGEDGRVRLAGFTATGPVIATPALTKQYHWQIVRPRSADVLGDQRINSFGVGGEVEVRSGLHVQRVPIESAVVHVGLGEAPQAEVVRIFWPNGTIQSEFELRADTAVTASQRLKGSCPWLFAWNGREMAWVTDVLWRSPLGLRINAQDTADVQMTEDRVVFPAGSLAPRDGAYDLRVTAELWETHFFDMVGLGYVDHPEGTEVFADERFAVPPPSLDLVATDPVRPFAAARDDRGQDVAAIVAARDDRHLDVAGRGRYQGITRPHYVELELPEEAPRSGPLWLIAQGWVHPTDSSINVAIAQGRHPAPEGLSLHVADRTGRFRPVRTGLGFPAGKDKTIRIDLSGVFPAEGPRRLRLATNLEIFWDRLGWAAGRPDVSPRITRLPLLSADLRYRGYSETWQRDASSPERARYVLAGTAPRWRDLEGYHTRFGDVLELVRGVDDRYAILNAGDELALRFGTPPPPAPGMTRTFVWIADGWEKDGDYNTTFSRTVLPLPSHADPAYATPPSRLEDDPVYRRHRGDFETYHTRYVTPAPVRDALAPAARPSSDR
ncbi:MAG TPA: FG-GAP-like repeat-containing protein [Vicinamibacterales bacterium]